MFRFGNKQTQLQRSQAAFVDSMLRFEQFYGSEISALIGQLKTKRDELQKKIDSQLWQNPHQKKVLGLHRTQIVRLNGAINRAKESIDVPHASRSRLEALYLQLLAIPRVLEVRVQKTGFAQEGLVIETDVLFGRSAAGTWHRIGPFTISVDFKAATDPAAILESGEITCIRWINKEGPREACAGPANQRDLWQSPMYISKQGHAMCFGNDRAMLRSALLGHDWPTVVQILVRYPECRGQKDAIRQWPKVAYDDVPEWYRKTFG